MKAWSRFAAVVCVALFSLAACAQPAPKGKPGDFTPEVGQEGKDVVWVPTSQALVNKMLDMAKVTPQDFLIDLGSGDGRTVITAAKRGVKAHGIEYNPDMVTLSMRNAEKEGVAARATFAKADLFESDFSRATVITMFLLPSINEKLRPKILSLKAGTRIVSNTFTMGDWEADETATVSGDEGSSYYRTALLWIVPAKIDGTWKSAAGDISFRQEYQHVSGSVSAAGSSSRINGGRLRGDELRFSAGGVQYVGKVVGDAIAGTATTGGNARAWSATRVK